MCTVYYVLGVSIWLRATYWIDSEPNLRILKNPNRLKLKKVNYVLINLTEISYQIDFDQIWTHAFYLLMIFFWYIKGKIEQEYIYVLTMIIVFLCWSFGILYFIASLKFCWVLIFFRRQTDKEWGPNSRFGPDVPLDFPGKFLLLNNFPGIFTDSVNSRIPIDPL